MKISYNWLKELIKLELSPDQISELLTGCGLEVEGIEKYASIRGGLKGVVVGEVKTCVQHPNADKLKVTTVDLGGPEPLQIVCGAPNVAQGQKVLVAKVGTMIYPSSGEPFEIKKAKIRGEVSEGMICAEDELGLGNSHAGIMVLPESCLVGANATEYFKVYEDFLIEIGLTANRGDAASHLGVARDLKALTGAEIQLKSFDINETQNDNAIKVEIQDSDACKRYSGIQISGITVKESPDWLKQKLQVIGINPINNIVDATNYVLHELGQPLHAFDADKIGGNKIIVRKAKKEEKFITLDKTERTLNGAECMICDAEKSMAIGGVFGGLDSGINNETKNIFIESAYFDAAAIRKAAKFHGLSTDASFRYERGTDPEITIYALKRVAALIIEIAGGQIASTVTDIYPAPIDKAVISFSFSALYKLIGQEIPENEVRRIIQLLDIQSKDINSDIVELTVPAYRSDIRRQADVAEEILRIYGLNKIEIPSQLKSVLTRSADEDSWLMRDRVANFLASNGYVEMLSNSLTKSANYDASEINNAVKILNPLSSDLDIMRMNLLFNGLEMVQYNVNRKVNMIKGFEYGSVYHKTEKGYNETPYFSIFHSGMQKEESWIEPQKSHDFFSLKEVVSRILNRTGITKSEWQFNTESVYLSNTFTVTHKNEIIAEGGLVKSEVLKKFDIDQPVYYAAINWNNLIGIVRNSSFKPKAISGFPTVRRDLALILDKTVSYAELEKLAFKAEPNLLKHMNVFDVYEGEKIGADKKSYALSFVLQDETKTLTDNEIDGVMSKIIKTYESKLNAVLRSA